MYATKEIQELVTQKNSLGALQLERATQSGRNDDLDFDIKNALINLKSTLDDNRIGLINLSDDIKGLKAQVENIQKLQLEQMQNKVNIECLKSFINKKKVAYALLKKEK